MNLAFCLTQGAGGPIEGCLGQPWVTGFGQEVSVSCVGEGENYE